MQTGWMDAHDIPCVALVLKKGFSGGGGGGGGGGCIHAEHSKWDGHPNITLHPCVWGNQSRERGSAHGDIQ